MTRYRVTDASGAVVAEGSFSSVGEAKEWACQLNIGGGWTLHHRVHGSWTPLRRYSGSHGVLSTPRTGGPRLTERRGS